jgi:hypothetical protein
VREDLQAARLELRLAELRELAAQAAIDSAQPSPAMRRLLEPLQAPGYSPWQAAVRRQTQRLVMAVRRRS